MYCLTRQSRCQCCQRRHAWIVVVGTRSPVPTMCARHDVSGGTRVAGPSGWRWPRACGLVHGTTPEPGRANERYEWPGACRRLNRSQVASHDMTAAGRSGGGLGDAIVVASQSQSSTRHLAARVVATLLAIDAGARRAGSRWTGSGLSRAVQDLESRRTRTCGPAADTRASSRREGKEQPAEPLHQDGSRSRRSRPSGSSAPLASASAATLNQASASPAPSRPVVEGDCFSDREEQRACRPPTAAPPAPPRSSLSAGCRQGRRPM